MEMKQMSFPKVPIYMNTSDNDFDSELYHPCLNWARRYDRAVGYFTSGWISKNAYGLIGFANNNGKARWITSPILDEKDLEIIKDAPDMIDIADYCGAIFSSRITNYPRNIV